MSLLKQKTSLLKEAFFYKFFSKYNASFSYEKLPSSFLSFLCYNKDQEIEGLEVLLKELMAAMLRMAEDIERVSEMRLSSTISEDESILREEEIFSLRAVIRDLEESKNTEIEKLSGENKWLRDRLEEKLRLSQYRGEVIDDLKREIAKLANEAEIGESRRLCYEYRIKVLEDRLEQNPLEESIASNSSREES
ncbi:hypothetical protein [Chlamydiifrater phoenicopteri]|uniref:hypothetical protein n=1 Tax=Chlamydiifrater phoenicopteri TaxID=2681469 RepID=UPI001BD143C1|nr:hypothetical protein [Chlamydiifrater phoenicopteri]